MKNKRRSRIIASKRAVFFREVFFPKLLNQPPAVSGVMSSPRYLVGSRERILLAVRIRKSKSSWWFWRKVINSFGAFLRRSKAIMELGLAPINSIISSWLVIKSMTPSIRVSKPFWLRISLSDAIIWGFSSLYRRIKASRSAVLSFYWSPVNVVRIPSLSLFFAQTITFPSALYKASFLPAG